jgi:hypothetical protein
VSDFEHKYKALKAAHREVVNIYTRERKMIAKDRQRIIQLCHDGLDKWKPNPTIYFEKILGILKAPG